MTEYLITPLDLGTIRRKKSNMAYMADDAMMDFPLIAWYLERTDGQRKIMVDTGGTAPDGEHWMPYSRTAAQDPANALGRAGVSPDEIDAVILTHLHWDHASNNALFPNAEFIVQQAEYDDISDTAVTEKPGFILPLIRNTRYTLVQGDTEVADGIRAVLTPGHTKGHQCLVVNTAAGPHIIGGDLVTLRENWTAAPKIPNGGHYSLDVIQSSLDKLAAYPGTILPGHDRSVFEKSVYGAWEP